MFEMISTVFIRHLNFVAGINDLTGIMPRLHKQSYLDATYDPISLDPGVLIGTKVSSVQSAKISTLNEKLIEVLSIK